ncbi:MAG: OpgC family protein [Beijerinckiaceae bacterium]
MSLSVASHFAFVTNPPAARLSDGAAPRDLRIDFFRGLALVMIFIDHISGNRLAALTLQRMGFADAAEVFVFIAGLTAVLAYRKVFERSGFRAACGAVFQRVRTLYLVHLATFIGVVFFATSANLAGTGFDIVRKLELAPLIAEPVQALLRVPVLGYMPNYLDILPLYVILLAFIPTILIGLKHHVLLPLGVALLVYGGATVLGANLPNFGSAEGWFLNPFAWALLFVIGATVAQLTISGFWGKITRLVKTGITIVALCAVAFAFLHAAPWRIFPPLEHLVVIPFAIESNKAFLSLNRLIDFLAKAWLVAVFIPSHAAFLVQGAGAAISRMGRHSLPVFTAGIFLSLAASVIIFEANEAPLAQIGTTFAGIAVMAGLAWFLERRKGFSAIVQPSIQGTSAA